MADAIDIVLVGYRLGDTAGAIKFCDVLTDDLRTGQKILVLNDWNLFEQLGDAARGWEVVRGSNSLGEFSGWQEGLGRLRAREATVVFANDTINSHRIFSMSRRHAFLKAVATEKPSRLIGFTDTKPGPLAVKGKTFPHWVSTYCFAATADTLSKLNWDISSVLSVDSCVRGGIDEDFFFDDISPALAGHLRLTLFGGGWYASQKLTSDNAEFFRFKARCIIAEKLLSARCLELGITLWDPFDHSVVAKQVDKVERRMARLFPNVYRKIESLQGLARERIRS